MIALASGPDPDEARELLRRELAKPEYNQPDNLVERVLDWLFERLSSLLDVIPGSGALSVALIAAVVTVAILAFVVALRRRRQDQGLSARTPGTVLEEESLSAAAFRERAERAARSGEWDAVLLDSYRALTASAGERTLLDDAPALTAHEVATSLASTFPGHAEQLRQAADKFDRVRYGQQPCHRTGAEAVRELDRSLRRARPVASWTSA